MESLPSDLDDPLEIIIREEDRELYNSRFVKYASTNEPLPGDITSYPLGTLIQLDQDTPNRYFREIVGKRIYRIRERNLDSTNNVESIIISHVYSPYEYRVREAFFLEWIKYDTIQVQ
jgi:hypothetical protein